MEDREYKDKVFLIECPECGSLEDMVLRNFSAFAVTGDVSQNKERPLRFYAKVVGFEDDGAPNRNWGMEFNQYKKKMGS